MRPFLAVAVLLPVALTAGCAAHVVGTARPGVPQQTASNSTVTSASVTSEYPDCVTDTLQYLDYLETGQPASLDLQYGPQREYVQNLTGDTRRIEMTKLADVHVRACELAQRTAQGRARAQTNARKEQSMCAQLKGTWSAPGNCVVTYTSPRWGSVGGYDVAFDEDGNVTGGRNGCPNRNWHADTRICVE